MLFRSIPDANRLGPEGLGFIHAMQVLDGGRISIAALALGIAQGAYESALRYSRPFQLTRRPRAIAWRTMARSTAAPAG